MPGRYLQHTPQEALERIARSSRDFSDHDMDVVVITCCDPRVADVVTDLPGTVFFRTPGCELDPNWEVLRAMMAHLPKTVICACHDDCKAHNSSMDEAQRQVQWAKHAFRHAHGAASAFLSGKVDSETRILSFFQDDGKFWDPGSLLRSVPHRTREAVERLLSVNERRRPMSERATTFLHPPVGVLAISVAGALSQWRERNVAYVIDHLGQPADVFDAHVRLIGGVVTNNVAESGDRTHLLVVGPEERLAETRKTLDAATSALTRVEGWNGTVELAVRTANGSFDTIHKYDPAVELR